MRSACLHSTRPANNLVAPPGYEPGCPKALHPKRSVSAFHHGATGPRERSRTARITPFSGEPLFLLRTCAFNCQRTLEHGPRVELGKSGFASRWLNRLPCRAHGARKRCRTDPELLLRQLPLPTWAIRAKQNPPVLAGWCLLGGLVLLYATPASAPTHTQTERG